MSATHELKTDPIVFDDVVAGRKLFEIRRDDRGFQVGDLLVLKRTLHTGEEMAGADGKPLIYTGDVVVVKVIHLLRGPVYGLHPGWVILSIEPLSTRPCVACEKRVAAWVRQYLEEWHGPKESWERDVHEKFQEYAGLMLLFAQGFKFPHEKGGASE